MANPQPEPFVKFSKELYDAFLRSPMPGVHRQVVEAVIRRTYGDHGKKQAPISVSLLVSMTGRARSAVASVLQDLRTEGVLRQVAKPTFTRPAVYALNKDYEQWGKWTVSSTSTADCPPQRTVLHSGKNSTSTADTGCPPQRTIEDKKNLETREDKKELASKIADAKGFDSFWETYPDGPNKTGKGAARTLWDKAVKKTEASAILAGLTLYLPIWASKDPQFIPAPKKWLEEGWWEDAPTNGSAGYGPGYNPTRERQERLEGARKCLETRGEEVARRYLAGHDDLIAELFGETHA
jgi:hypothetical protein